MLFRYFCPNSRPGWILLGAPEERKKLPKIKVGGRMKTPSFFKFWKPHKRVNGKKIHFVETFPSYPTFPLTNEVSGLSNEPWELQKQATQYRVLTPQLAAASDWSRAHILASDWLILTPVSSLQSSGHKWDASLVLTGQSCAKKNFFRSKFY